MMTTLSGNTMTNLSQTSISIVLAAYNGQAYISQQLQSILPQLQKGDELIISLDPSTDQTQAMLLEFIQAHQDQPAHLTLLQGPGQGVVKNFEQALNQVHNDIVVLCDQDDVWFDHKLDRLRQVFADNPKLQAVVHDAIVCDANLKPIASSFMDYHHSQKGFLQNLLRNSFIGCCMAMRKEIIEHSLPFPAIPMHDQFLGLQALRTGDVLFLKEPLIYYRRHENNASSLHPASLSKQLRWRLQIVKALQERPMNKEKTL